LSAADSRKREVKRCAFLFLAFGPDAASMTEQDALDIGKADASALKFLFKMEALKNAEEFANVLHIETYTIIADEDNVLVAIYMRADFDFGRFPRTRVFDGVGNQVGENNPKHRPISQNLGQRTDVPFNRATAKVVLQALSHIDEEVLEINANRAHFGAGHTGELQQIVHELAHLAGGSADAIQMMKGLRVEGLADILFEQVHEAGQVAEWRAEIVRNGIAEGFQFFIGVGKLRGAEMQIGIELDDLGFDLLLDGKEAVAFGFGRETSSKVALEEQIRQRDQTDGEHAPENNHADGTARLSLRLGRARVEEMALHDLDFGDEIAYLVHGIIAFAAGDGFHRGFKTV
jgi:hypothetical protein